MNECKNISIKIAEYITCKFFCVGVGCRKSFINASLKDFWRFRRTKFLWEITSKRSSARTQCRTEATFQIVGSWFVNTIFVSGVAKIKATCSSVLR